MSPNSAPEFSQNPGGTEVPRGLKPAPRTAIGFRVHSGWAAMVAVAREGGAYRVVDRRIITVIDSKMAGAKQPYHYVEQMELAAAEKHLAKVAAMADRMAVDALGDLHVAGAAILLASGRPLPELPRILASHALIHTAEGEFFRDVFRRACGRLEIPVIGIRERELTGQGMALPHPGPPWAQDQKLAALGACRVLADL